MARLYGLLAAIVAILGGIAAVFYKGKSIGKKQEQDKQKDEYIKTVEQVKGSEIRIPADDRDVADRLRDRWTRD